MEILGRDSNLRSVAIVGDYGSGKTEIAVNLALHLAASRAPSEVALADLDLVNPYFRCREASEPLEKAGVKVVVPQGGQRFADLPILLPEIKGLLDREELVTILDVGGDEVGSRVLSSLGPAFSTILPGNYGVWFVINANRPFASTVDGCLRAIRRIESSSGLSVTGLVANTHLMEETTSQMIREGVRLTEQVASQLGVPICLVALMESFEEWESSSHPVLRMRRLMVPPWIRRDGEGQGLRAFRPRPT